MKKCLICKKGTLEKVEDIIFEVSGYVLVLKGERCIACHEEIPYEEETRKAIDTAKKLSVWPEPLKIFPQPKKLSSFFEKAKGSSLRPDPFEDYHAHLAEVSRSR